MLRRHISASSDIYTQVKLYHQTRWCAELLVQVTSHDRWCATTSRLAGVLRWDDVTTIQSYCPDRKLNCHHQIASSPDRRSQIDLESRVLLFVTSHDRSRSCRSQKILSCRSHEPRILSSTTPNNVTTSRCQLVWTECKVLWNKNDTCWKCIKFSYKIRT